MIARTTTWLLIILLALLSASCRKRVIATRIVDVGRGVRTLTLCGNFEIEHTNDSEPSLVVEGEEEGVASLRVVRAGDSLYLEGASVNSYLKWRDVPLKVRVGFLPSEYMRISGGGEYRFLSQGQFKRFELRVEHYAGRIEADLDGVLFFLRADEAYGEMVLRGKAVGALLKSDGGHTMHAKDFHVRWLRVLAGSRSGVYVRPIEQLAITYWLVGATVHYYGNPKRIIQNQDGYTGNLIRGGA